MLRLPQRVPADFSTGAAQLLAEFTLARLDALDHAAAVGGRAALSPVCEARLRADVREAVEAFRRLLRRHEPDWSGRCPTCRSWIGRRRRWPCPVWRRTHDFLLPIPNGPGFALGSS